MLQISIIILEKRNYLYLLFKYKNILWDNTGNKYNSGEKGNNYNNSPATPDPLPLRPKNNINDNN